MTDVLTRIVQKTAAAWTSANPVLPADEIGYESDTGYEKQGDGSTDWNTLPYLPSVGPAGNPDPSWNGYTAWSFDPLIAGGGGIALTTGVQLVTKMRMTKSASLSKISVRVNTAGTSLSNCFAGLLDASGALLGTTADQSTAWQASGDKIDVSLVAATSVQKVGSFIYAVLLANNTAGSNPAFRSSTGAANPSAGITAAAQGFRFGTVGTGLTAVTATALTAVTATATSMPWVAVR